MRKAAALRRLPVRLDRVDLVIAVVDAWVVMHFAEDEVLEFRTEIGSVADAGAGAATSEGSRELLITKGKSESDDVLVACAIQARDWPPPLSRSLQGLPHDQAEWPGTRAVDLSLDHRRARRTIVGERQFAPGRGLPIHVAHQTRPFSAPMMCRRAPACSDPRWPLCGRNPRSSHRVSNGSCWRAAKARRSLLAVSCLDAAR
jgi:hypothetical protein